MLKAEATWVGQALERMRSEELSPLLNVGSATATFRETVQPWISHEIFAPLERKGVTVNHLDIQEGDGIDLHGDLTDDAFMASLGRRGYRSLLCCNVLEHVDNPAAISRRLEELMPAMGYLIVTVPNRFPYHPDPIDTMFRPDISDLLELFPRCGLREGKVLDCGTGWDYVDRSPAAMVSKVKRRVRGMKEHGGVKGTTSFLPWLFRQFRITCVVLRKR